MTPDTSHPDPDPGPGRRPKPEQRLDSDLDPGLDAGLDASLDPDLDLSRDLDADAHARPPALLVGRGARGERSFWATLALRVRAEGRLLRERLSGERSVRVGGVRYKRRRARRGDHADYDVTFITGATMRITPTPERVYRDLKPCVREAVVRRIGSEVRPGHRVVWLGAGTGAGPAEVARLVGPSGAVVALDRDRESIRFARRRYAVDNVAYEHGGAETLSGELDRAFDAAVVFLRPNAPMNEQGWREVGRVVAPGGWIAAAVIDDADEGSTLRYEDHVPAELAGADAMIGPERVRAGESAAVVAVYPTETGGAND